MVEGRILMVIRDKLWVTSIILSILGLLDSTYLTWIKVTHNEASCIKGVGDCFSVNTSAYSEWHGIPVALIGVLGYASILVILLMSIRISFLSLNGSLIIFGLTLIGVAFSAYLTYIEVAILKTICPYCILSALMMLSLFVISIVRMTRDQEI
jgi:uncharacterized membrane protein